MCKTQSDSILLTKIFSLPSFKSVFFNSFNSMGVSTELSCIYEDAYTCGCEVCRKRICHFMAFSPIHLHKICIIFSENDHRVRRECGNTRVLVLTVYLSHLHKLICRYQSEDSH